MPRVTTVSFHFGLKWRHFATTFATVGGSLGAAVSPFLFQLLLACHPWQHAFVYLSCILIQTVVCGALFGPTQRPSHRGSVEEVRRKKSVKDGLTDAAKFWALPVFCLHSFLWGCAEWADCIFALWLTSEHYNTLQVAALLTIMTSTCVLGTILASLVTHFCTHQVVLFSNLSVFLMGVTTFVLSRCNTFRQFAVYKAIMGMFFGAACGFMPAILLELVSLKRLNRSYGIVQLLIGTAGVLSPPAAGNFIRLYSFFEK